MTGGGGGLVVHLTSAGQHVGVVDAVLEHRVFLDHTPTLGAHERRKRARMNPQLLGAVAVEVEPLDHESLAAAQLGFGQRQVPPDRVSQVRDRKSTRLNSSHSQISYA